MYIFIGIEGSLKKTNHLTYLYRQGDFRHPKICHHREFHCIQQGEAKMMLMLVSSLDMFAESGDKALLKTVNIIHCIISSS